MQLYEVNEFRASKAWPYAISAGCLVFRKQAGQIEVLLLTRDYDHDWYSAGSTERPSYHIPKGHLEFNETLEECAQRETLEEIGAKVALKSYLGALFHNFEHPKFKNTANKVVHYFAAEWLEDVSKTDNEHDGGEWVELKQAAVLLGKPNPKGENEIAQRLVQFLELTNAT